MCAKLSLWLIAGVIALSLRIATSANVPKACRNDDHNAATDFHMQMPIQVLLKLNSVLRSSAQLGNIAGSVRQCMREIFLETDEFVTEINNRISSLQARLELKTALREARDTFSPSNIVYEKYREMIEFPNEHTKSDVIQACQMHDPATVLKLFLSNKLLKQPKLLDELMTGTQFSIGQFNNLTSDIYKEAALCAVLAHNCFTLLHERRNTMNETYAAWREWQIDKINDTLSDIHRLVEITQAKFKERFLEEVPSDIEKALAHIEANALVGKHVADYIHKELSEKYPFRLWSVLIYERAAEEEGDSDDSSSYHHETGPSSKWFIVSDSVYRTIVHSANREANCGQYEQLFHGKRLRHWFPDDASYALFSSSNMGISDSVQVLLRHLSPHLPQEYFIAVARFSFTLKVARDAEASYNFYQPVQDVNTEEWSKAVLIGWC